MKLLASVCIGLLVSCAAQSSDSGEAEDGEFDVATGKADSPAEGSADAARILALVNDTGMSDADFDNAVGLSARVAEGIVKHRDGADREPGTADDDLFDTLAELDAVPYLGPVAMRAILTYAKKTPATTFTIQLIAREWVDGPDQWFDVELASLNGEMAEYGIAFPKTLTLGARDGAKFNKVLADIAVANDKLGREIELDHTWDPSEYRGLCYTGGISGVPALVEGLRESMFSIYMGIQAERWGSRKTFHYSGAGGDNEAEWIAAQEEQENTEAISVWKRFDTSSASYLMMTDGGQQGDGTELFAVLIEKCN